MLRESVSLMAVGLELPRSDTVAEDTRAVAPDKATAKELGDVRSASQPHGCTITYSACLAPTHSHIAE